VGGEAGEVEVVEYRREGGEGGRQASQKRDEGWEELMKERRAEGEHESRWMDWRADWEAEVRGSNYEIGGNGVVAWRERSEKGK